LAKIFERRTNFDLRRLLGGTETFLHSFIEQLEFDLGISNASLCALKMDPVVRANIAEILVPPKELKDVLYVALVSSGLVVTLVRPKKHSIHPADLHILLNTLSSPSLASTPISWLPICLPKFNPNKFLHAYISHLEDEVPNGSEGENNESVAVRLAVVIPDKDGFERVRQWAGSVTDALSSSGLLQSISSAVRAHTYLPMDIGVPGLRHFVYKSRSLVQITMPGWTKPYDNLDDRRRLVTLYQTLHDAVHARSGQPQGPLKLQYIRTDKESVMGWATHPFELYLAMSPRLPKSAVVGAANAIARWIKKEEGKLFLRDAPVF